MPKPQPKPRPKPKQDNARTGRTGPERSGRASAKQSPAAKKGTDQARGESGGAVPARKISFTAALRRPAKGEAGATGEGVTAGKPATWMFLRLPRDASAKLASRGMVSVEGTLSGAAFQATLQPDGEGGHWLKVERALREAADAKAGDTVSIEIAPMAEEPEPEVPAELRRALANAPAGKAGAPGAREVWEDITPSARRDWIHWMESAKQAETRARRVATAMDMLAKGKRRPCCFDRSGMYSKSLGCPVAADETGAE